MPALMVLFAIPVWPCSVERYADLVKVSRFEEKRADGKGGIETAGVEAGIWNPAIQRALDVCDRVDVPAREQPYYIDRPLVLRSGNHLRLAQGAEIRLKPGSNTCMARNRNIVSGAEGPVAADQNPDTDITIEGGIWSTLSLSRSENNGNVRGWADSADSIPGAHGVILLSNVRKVTVRNLTIRRSKPFGVQISNASRFVVENLTFEEHWRDGVHVNGPANEGVIRGVRGVTYDDFVALNAWDWRHYAVTFGPIAGLTVEAIEGSRPRMTESTTDTHHPDGSAEIRLLPGVKRFASGQTLDCEIRDSTFRRIRDVRTFKMYDQPNLEQGRDQDFSAGVGKLSGLVFEDIEFARNPALPPFMIHADAERLTFREIRLKFPVRPDFRLVRIGPLSATYKRNSTDPSQWVEIFSPDRDCTVRSLKLTGVRTADGTPIANTDELVEAVSLQINKDYPRSTPRGGTGRGRLIP